MNEERPKRTWSELVPDDVPEEGFAVKRSICSQRWSCFCLAILVL
jgi:hypothetical protein